MRQNLWWRAGLVAWMTMVGPVHAEPASSPFPTVHLHAIPEALQQQYMKLQPEMNQYSHCAAAFDGTDPDKMAFRCSIYVRMSAEGERRAMRYCEEKREEHKINGPCRLIVE